MKITKKELLEGLATLDVANDLHWTEEGLPVLEVVQDTTLDDTITRDDVTLNASGFSRANAEGFFDAPKAPSVDQAASAPSGGDEAAQERRTELQAVVTAARQAIEDQDAVIVQAKRDRENLVVGLDKAIKELEAEFPPIQPAHAIQDWLASEAAKRAARVNQTYQVKAPMSPIDQSMQRATGHGRGRKFVPPVAAQG